MERTRELSRNQRRLLIVAAILELCLKVVAGIDIARRPANQIRGPKRAWFAALGINFFGPVAYFALGRRNS